MAVLLCLAEQPGEVCSRQHIFGRVWGQAELTDEVLTQAIAELRRALGDDPRRAGIIQTVPRRGYRLVPAVRVYEQDSKSTTTLQSNVQDLSRLLEPTPTSALVGRHPELALLVQMVQQTETRQNSCVLLSGEPGIGKTRLAQEALKIAADTEQLVLFGRCSENQGSGQYLPFAEIIEQCIRVVPAVSLRGFLGDTAPDLAQVFPELGRVFPDLPPPVELPPEQRQRYLFNTFLDFLRKAAAMQPVCLLLDDLQWADEPTLALLRHLAANLGSTRVLIIGTFRDSEADVTEPFADLLDDLIAHRLAQRIPLRRLNQINVGEMLASLTERDVPPAWSEAVFDRTEGNPFFVEELFRHIKEEGKALDRRGNWRSEVTLGETELPEGLRWVLDRRLKRRSEETVLLLRAAALIGRTFSIRVLRPLAESQKLALAPALDEAEQTGVITPRAAQSGEPLHYSFCHDLYRHALLGQLSAVYRQKLHRQIAQEMETLYADALADHAADIAFHLHESGDADAAALAHYWHLAAQTAFDKAAGAEALDFVNRSLELSPADTEPAHAELMFLKSQVLRSLVRWPEAMAGWQSALAAFQACGEPEGVARCCANLGEVLSWLDDGDAACQITQLGMNALGDAPHPLKVVLLCAQSMGHVVNGDLSAAGETLDRARSVAEPLQIPPLMARLEMTCGLIATLEIRPENARRHLAKCIGPLKNLRDLWSLAPAMASAQIGLIAGGEWADAEAMSAEVRRIADSAGNLGAMAWSRRCDALIALAKTGDVAEFENAEREALAIGENLTIIVHGESLALAEAAALQNRPDDALALCAQAEKIEPVSWRGSSWALQLKIGASFDRADRLDEFDDYTGFLRSEPRLRGWADLKTVVDLAEGLAYLDRLDLLNEYYPLIEGSIADSGAVFMPIFPQLLQKTLGILAAGREDWRRAEAHFQTALEQASQLPHVLEHAETLRWYAWMLARRDADGSERESLRWLERARHAYAALKLDGLAERCSAQVIASRSQTAR